MAYRRKQGGLSRSSTFNEEIRRPPDHDDITTSSSSPTAHPHTTSQARLDTFLSSGAFHSSFKDRSKGNSATYDYTSRRSRNEAGGFWGVLARKAKAILEDEVPPSSTAKPDTVTASTRMGLARNQIADSIGNALEEAGRSKKSEDMMEESCKVQNRRRALNDEEKNQIQGQYPRMQSAQPQTFQETQLKASRDVAIAAAAKAKLLLHELKTVKAELSFAKERCCQLEEENKILREAHEKGDNPADDDMIRVQLETLLEEKGRLAHENSVYARENRYLREIVEYHQLRMEDVVYFDEELKGVSRTLSV